MMSNNGGRSDRPDRPARPDPPDQPGGNRHTSAHQKIRAARSTARRRGAVVLVIVAVAAIMALTVANRASPSATGPLNMASDGILFGGDGTTISAVRTPALSAEQKPVATDPSALADTVNITIYADYLCVFCARFEAANAVQLASWVTAGNATVELHPISILDTSSLGTNYSTRAANAAACVANTEPDRMLPVNTALFANQPAPNSGGLTDAELQQIVEDAGATDTTTTTIASCIANQTFAPWVHAASDRALSGPLPNTDVEKVTGTPTVLVNGVPYGGSLTNAAAFEAFVTAQTGAPLR